MNRTYLYVPPEDRSEVEALGALWDTAAKSWYVEGVPPLTMARWSGEHEKSEYSIESNDAYVASARIQCPHCNQETEVICIHCRSGKVLEESVERFTIADIWAMDDSLLEELSRWPSFRRVTNGDEFGEFANHCISCDEMIGDIDLHSEPDQAFFDIEHGAIGAVTLISLPQTVKLTGNEHYVID